MSSITFGPEGRIRPAAVVRVGLVLSAVAFAIDALIASAAPSAFGAPGEVPGLGLATVLMMSAPAVLGNTLGFYMSYRRYVPRALVTFLAPAAGFFVAFMTPHVWALLTGGTLAAFALAATLSIVPVAIAVPTLLALRPDGVSETVPDTVPDNVRGFRAGPTVEQIPR